MDFYSTLLAHGLHVTDSPVPGDVIRRCNTDTKPKHKNGWYKLAPDGQIGWFGDFTVGLSAEWKSDGVESAIVPRSADTKRRNDQRALVVSAIAGARKCWHSLRPMSTPHPYIAEAKNLSVHGCAGLRIDENGAWFKAWYKHKGVELHTRGDLLVVPMYRGAHLMSLQAIDSRGKKLFWKDAPTKGCRLRLDRPNCAITILTEGLATGLVLYQSVPNSTVIVCFSADNMVTVAEGMGLHGMAVVAADNDHATHARTGTNPGIEKGLAAAAVLGCQACWPEGLQGSDWCDLYNETSFNKNAVRVPILRAARPVRKEPPQA